VPNNELVVGADRERRTAEPERLCGDACREILLEQVDALAELFHRHGVGEDVVSDDAISVTSWGIVMVTAWSVPMVRPRAVRLSLVEVPGKVDDAFDHVDH
jgi:hypothetical protein